MDIWASILECLISGKATMNKIRISANLNQKGAEKHLKEMIARGLIQRNRERFVNYSISVEGIRWLKIYRSLTNNESRKAYELRVDFQ